MSLINSIPEYNLLEFEEFEDYEKNDLVIGVIDDLKLFFQSSSCKCVKTTNDPHSCFEKIGFKNFFERHFEFKSLDKKEKELSIKTQLMVFQFDNEDIRHNYKYKYNETIQICKPVFLKLCDIKEGVLKVLQKHGNMKNIPKFKSWAFVDLEVAEGVKNVMLNYMDCQLFI